MNAAHLADYGDPEIDTRISQYEMAFRMQTSVPDLVDFSNESKTTLDRYGPDALQHGTFANNCLIARRLLERGVRFVQLMHSGWDQHGNLFTQLEQQCKDTEGPSAALVRDLKERGMLDDTLVIWGGEFGRTPFGQGDPANPTGSRPLRQGLQLVARGRRRQTGHGLWVDRRLRLEHHVRPGPRPRHAGDDPAPLRDRPHEADLPLSRPPVPPDRRPRQSRDRSAGLRAGRRTGPRRVLARSPRMRDPWLSPLGTSRLTGWAVRMAAGGVERRTSGRRRRGCEATLDATGDHGQAERETGRCAGMSPPPLTSPSA